MYIHVQVFRIKLQIHVDEKICVFGHVQAKHGLKHFFDRLTVDQSLVYEQNKNGLFELRVFRVAEVARAHLELELLIVFDHYSLELFFQITTINNANILQQNRLVLLASTFAPIRLQVHAALANALEKKADIVVVNRVSGYNLEYL
jgi:hypothetical protein